MFKKQKQMQTAFSIYNNTVTEWTVRSYKLKEINKLTKHAQNTNPNLFKIKRMCTFHKA